MQSGSPVPSQTLSRVLSAIWVLALVTIGSQASLLPAQETGEEPAFLGVQLREETEHPDGGARVTHVVAGSPADAAGFQKDDIVVEFEGAPIRGPLALTQRIHTKRAGDRVTLTVIRGSQAESLEVELGKRVQRSVPLWKTPPPTPPEPRPDVEPPEERFELLVPEPRDLSRFLEPLRWGDKPRLGVQLVETTPELRLHLGGSESRGVLVSKVLSGMPAERAGLQVGDLIVAVDGESVASSSELILALSDKLGRTFPVEIVRDGSARTIEVTIPEPELDRPTGPRA